MNYLINMDFSISLISELITYLGYEEVKILGYSQGGYLLPELAMQNDSIKKIILINASIKYKSENIPSCDIYCINSKEDKIIEHSLVKKRFDNIKTKGIKKFILIENENHYLSENLVNIATNYL